MELSGVNNFNKNNVSTNINKDSGLRKELAGLRMDMLAGEMSDAERSAMQSLLMQAEKAIDDGNTFAARGIIDEAGKTFENNSQDSPDSTEDSYSPSSENISRPEVDKHTYQDASSDPSVSFKFPTKINEYQAEIAVGAHESEHVRDAVFKAQNEKTLANVQIRYHYGLDSKGKRYIKGGTTKVTFPTRNIHVKLRQAKSSSINKKA
ncbi:MAG: hypothetical protein GY863_18320 [bacterium]|nr:hypothetical protein [bacterium]